jgi:hypothetical protein
MIDLTKPVQTRSGLPARIVSENGRGAFPVLVIITDPDGSEFLHRVTHAGSSTLAPSENAYDIVNVPEETEEFRNIYLKGFYEDDPEVHISHAHADGVKAGNALREADAPDSFTIRIRRNVLGQIKDVALWNYDPMMGTGSEADRG